MKNTDKENVYSSWRLPKDLSFQIGDCVLVRNYRRRSKFAPYFLLEKFCVIEILANVNSLSKENTVSGICLQRDNNDIKLLNGSIASLYDQAFKNDSITFDENLHWKNGFDFIDISEHSDNDETFQKANPSQVPLRISTRLRRPNSKYFSDYFET